MGPLMTYILKKWGMSKGLKMLKKLGFSGKEIGKHTADMSGKDLKKSLAKLSKKDLEGVGSKAVKTGIRSAKSALINRRGGLAQKPKLDVFDKWRREERFRGIDPVRGVRTDMDAFKFGKGIPVGGGIAKGVGRLPKAPKGFLKRPKSALINIRGGMAKLRQTALNRRVFEFQQWALNKFGKVITPDQARMVIKMGAAGLAGGAAGYGLAGGFGGGEEAAPMQGPPGPEPDRFTTMAPSGV